MKKHRVPVLLLLIFSVWSIKPLFSSGFFPMHDDTQVGRVVVMGRALRNGQFPVRWVSDLGYGYGYPMFNFYGPLPYYVGGALHALGVSGLVATKAMFVIGIVSSAMMMYGLASWVFGRLAGLLSGLLYLYAPYHAVQIYVRGAVGEFWASGFLPLIPLGILLTCREKERRRGILIGGIALALVILSHTIFGYVTTLLLVLSLILYWLMRFVRRTYDTKLLTSHVLLLVTGLGLSAFFWFPALGEMRHTAVKEQIGGSASFLDHFVCPLQLWNSPWGFGGSVPGCIDGMSFKLGKLHVILAVIVLVLAIARKRFMRKERHIIFWASVIGGASLFLALPQSALAWLHLPKFAYVQYPWRFLSFALIGISFVGGGLVQGVPAGFRRVITTTILAAAVLVVNAKLFIPQYQYPRTLYTFESEEDLRWRVSKISDEYLPHGTLRPSRYEEIAREALPSTPTLKVETEIDTETYIKFLVASKTSQTVTIHRAYFPGWRYFVDGQGVVPQIRQGLPLLTVLPGDHVIELRFRNTLIRTVANLISLVTAIVYVSTYGKKTYA